MSNAHENRNESKQGERFLDVNGRKIVNGDGEVIILTGWELLQHKKKDAFTPDRWYTTV